VTAKVVSRIQIVCVFIFNQAHYELNHKTIITHIY